MGKLTDDTSGTRPLQPGETRTWTEQKSGKTFTLTRTTRDYVYDLCDCYNAARTRDAIDRGVEWFVAPNGELRIGTADDWSRANRKRIEGRNETERARHNRLQLESERRGNAYQHEPEPVE